MSRGATADYHVILRQQRRRTHTCQRCGHTAVTRYATCLRCRLQEAARVTARKAKRV